MTTWDDLDDEQKESFVRIKKKYRETSRNQSDLIDHILIHCSHDNFVKNRSNTVAICPRSLIDFDWILARCNQAIISTKLTRKNMLIELTELSKRMWETFGYCFDPDMATNAILSLKKAGMFNGHDILIYYNNVEDIVLFAGIYNVILVAPRVQWSDE